MQKNLRRFIAITLTVFSLGFCGCMKERKIVSAEISKNYKKSAQVSGEVTDSLIASISNFSLQFFKSCVNGTQNSTLSPLSAYMCLALLQNGANGETKREMESVLGLATNELNPAMQAYLANIPSDENCSFIASHSLWFKQDDVVVLPTFLQTNADYFGAQAYASKFDETTVQDINNWCYNQTGGKIDKIIDTISAGTVMYAINALDFDGAWATPYEKKDIQKGIFNAQNGETQETMMLHSTENTYYENENAIGFSKPYAGNHYSFLAFLPKENQTLSSLISSLSFSTWNTLTQGESGTVCVQMPAFTQEQEMDITGALQNLGVKSLFDASKADLSNISTTQALYCSAVKQKVKIQVDSNGTKASAVTWGEMKTTSLPHGEIYITLDRPFLYAIVENSTKLPIFLGTVTSI